ncbi:MAG TPA: hypothetical protein VHT00_01265 [Stellaceae bacterium]|jgi:hypothetical protein|nr:hypothetical protein [Stellaceae bacterium]
MRAHDFSADDIKRIAAVAFDAVEPLWRFAHEEFEGAVPAYALGITALVCGLFDELADGGDSVFANMISRSLAEHGHPWRIVRTS